MTSAAGSRRRSRATCREVVRALVVSPPLPGAGERVLTAETGREVWYQAFHQLTLIEEILDGDPAAVRAVPRALLAPLVRAGVRADRRAARPSRRRLRRAGRDGRIGRLVPGRVGDGRERARGERSRGADRDADHVLWQSDDPLFPRAWSDRLDRFFSDFELRPLDGVGHFTPLEAPQAFADAIDEFLGPRSS